jgi:predicted DNA-binding ribbon-helix-helix protein
MVTDTATIRVARGTRDLLAEQARARGMPLAALLAEIAHEREIESICESERRATRADAQNLNVLEEMRLWEATLDDDGIE